jgi:semaphorin 6
MDDIKAAFDGQFKGQDDSNSNWLPVQNSKVPEPRPGKCVNDSRTLPEATLNFIKDHTLMDQSIPNFWGHPLFVQSSFKFRFTQIAVDPQIETVSGKTYDVLFIGTDDGRVLKVINAAAAAPSGHAYHNKVMPVIIEETTVFPNKLAISNLLVYHTFYEAKLLVVSSSEIQAIPLHKCQARASTCGTCVKLQDPYCAWDIARQLCTSSRSRFWNRDNFVQNIEEGWDNRCPDVRPSSNEIPDVSAADKAVRASSESDAEAIPLPAVQLQYSAETFALAVVTSIVTSFVIGFILGYIFSRRCSKGSPGHHPHYGHHSAMGFNPYSDPTGYTDYQLHHPVHHSDHYATQLSLGQGPGGGNVMMSSGGGLVSGNTGTLITTHHQNNSSNNKPINLVLNVPTTNKNGKNANSSADNKPMMQKVKKIYL